MSAGKIGIFCSYAHEDREVVKHLIRHMGEDYIIWCDIDIAAGQSWEKEIINHLNSDKIIFLLISSYFKSSDFCCKIEMQRALEREKEGEANVIPIILSPVFWPDAPYKYLQCLPTKERPITKWKNKDDAFVDIAKNVRPIINRRLKDLYINDAKSCIISEKMEAAREICQLALDIPDSNTTLDKALGHVFYDLKCFDKALALYEKVLEFDKKDADLYGKIGDARSALGLGYLDEALKAYDQAITLEPSGAKRSDLLQKKADVCVKRITLNKHMVRDVYQDAIDVIESTSENDSKKELIRNLGNRLAELGELEEALRAYNEAIELDPNNVLKPDNAFLYKERGDVFYNLYRFTDALVEYKKAACLPDFDLVREILRRIEDEISLYFSPEQHPSKKNDERDNTENRHT